MRPALTGRFDDTVRLLTPRERDCLGHLENGATAAMAAAVLGISRSTFNAHLMSARRKLGARNTTHALLMLARRRIPSRDMNGGSVSEIRDLPARLVGLVDALQAAESFSEAWRSLHVYASELGITNVNVGVIAEPTGALDPDNWSVWMSMPEEMFRLYYDMGGALADPVAHYIGHGTRPLIVDPEYILEQAPRSLPPAMYRMAAALMDARLNRQLAIPYRDPMTGAPVGLVYRFDLRRRPEFQAAVAALSDELNQAAAIFWDHIQRAAFLSGVPGLSPREKEALKLLARGFALAEAAEHIGVSLRSVEKFLAGARAKLHTRTNAQSLYRAMVYRALD
jgi:DNA-binding CsgD family transcriptional regulator